VIDPLSGSPQLSITKKGEVVTAPARSHVGTPRASRFAGSRDRLHEREWTPRLPSTARLAGRAARIRQTGRASPPRPTSASMRCRRPSCRRTFRGCVARGIGARHFRASWVNARAASSMCFARMSAAPACRATLSAALRERRGACPSEEARKRKSRRGLTRRLACLFRGVRLREPPASTSVVE
jgi:hypothetical protein